MGLPVVLDFETAFKSKGTKDDPKYSLSGMTYEEYIFDPRFKIFGCGIRIGMERSVWYTGEAMERKLHELFGPGNQNTAIAHNGYFDFAILGWLYNLHPHTRLCTMSMSKALWPHESSSLDKLTKRLFPNDPTKHKGKELMSVDGLWELTPEQDAVLAGYCNQDVDITFDAFAAMYHAFPKEEFPILDLTLEFFSDPLVQVDVPRVQRHIENEKNLRIQLLDTFAKREKIPPERAAKILSSNDKYAEFLQMCKGIEPPVKDSMANPDEETWAFAKDDIAYQKLQKEHPHLDHIWEARKAIKSTQEISRANRLIVHSHNHSLNRLAVPLKYCGAHTTRWSGMNSVNLQNLKRGGELRKCLVAPEGQLVIVADLSNIESRMLAWMANDEGLLSAYANKRDIYSEFASKVFGRTIDRKRKAYDADGNEYYPDETEGFIGKVCIAEGTPVLTDKGWIPVERVSTDSKVWDGIEWVQHDGPLYNGLKNCIPLSNAFMTPDHKILCGTEWKEAQSVAQDNDTLYRALGIAAESLPSQATSKALVKASAQSSKISNRESENLRRVYDIVNAGPRTRYTILTDAGPLIVHNCILGLGYGMGWKKFQDTLAKGAMGGPPVEFSDIESKRIVDLYRANYHSIPTLWKYSERILFEMCRKRPEITHFGPCEVQYQKLILPNGLALHYPGLKYDEETQSFSFYNGKFRQKIYGGLFVENIIQAISRVLFGQAAVEINKEYKQMNGRLITLTHDETVGVVDQKNIIIAKDITSAIMSKRRPWCDDKRLVLASEVKYAREYSK